MKTVKTNNAPQAIGPYVQGKIVGNLLFASGQVPLSPKTGLVVGTEIIEQTHQVMKNIAGVLDSINANFNDIVKTTCFLTNMENFEKFNEVYASYFNVENLPARSCVEVSKLPKSVLVEIECIVNVP